MPITEESLSLVHAESLTPKQGEDLTLYAELPFIAFAMDSAPGIAECALKACARAGFTPKTIF